MGLTSAITSAFSRKKAELVFNKDLAFSVSNKVVKIGRTKEKAPEYVFKDSQGNIRLPSSPVSATISRDHGELHWDAQVGKYKYKDVGSKMGSWVNGVKIPVGKEVTLQDKAKVGIGQAGVIKFQILY
jgi:pSer/pThr/pTyr-binding forkhead associated (FHA) protein